MALIGIIVLNLVWVLAAAAAIVVGIEYLLAGRGYTGPVTDHFDGKRFYSIGTGPRFDFQKEGQKKSAWKWILFSRRPNKWVWKENKLFPVPAERVNDGIVVTFVNHATVLVQVAGLNIITDPIWTKRASPFSFAGPSRFRAPGIALEDLPPIDIVLVSHNHYDHMDLATLRKISKKWRPKIYTGLGNSAYLADRDIANAQDMDWWDRTEHGPVTIVATPAQHFSARAIRDRNTTLWCGFMIETSYGPIYFVGDTGYGAFAQEVKKRYDKFILAFVPIGAYLPDWMMRKVHMSPDEAFVFHKELNIRTSIGIHHSTFKLADDQQDEPIERISELVDADPEKPDFRVLDHGESISVARETVS